MSFINDIMENLGLKETPQMRFKKKVISCMDLDELEEIAKKFISRDPKVQYEDHMGRVKFRKPTREEYEKSLFFKVDISDILDMFDRLKEKFTNPKKEEEEE